MSLSRAVSIIVLVAIIAGIIVVGYGLLSDITITRRVNLPHNLLASTSTQSTDGQASSTEKSGIDMAQFSRVDTSSWKIHNDDELGYSIKYPTDLIVSNNGSVLTLLFPKNIYFHWPLQDDARVIVTVASSCPPLSVPDKFSASTTEFTLNGYAFTGSEGHEGTAGNLYHEWAYDTIGNSVCYHLTLFDQGASGAGLFVDNRSLIEQYDNQHDRNIQTILDVFYGIVNSFRIKLIPDGSSEDRV